MAVLQIFLIATAAGILVRRKIISNENIKSLSSVTIQVFLPCLIFSKITGSFEPNSFNWWWILPLCAVGIVAIGLFFSALLFVCDLPEKKNMLSLSSIQNAVYLVLPIGNILFHEQFDRFALYNFLFALGVSALTWSVGKYLNTHHAQGERIKISSFLTAPLFANIISLLIVLFGIQTYIPQIIRASTNMIGDATVPVANFVLGATLGSISIRDFPRWIDILRVAGVKFILIPVSVIAVLYSLKIPDEYALLTDFFVMQASSAPATALILQVRNYGGDSKNTGSIMLISYFICIVAMPFWVSLWRTIAQL